MKKILKVHPNDNVIVALEDLKAGEKVSFQNEVFHIQMDIPAKHKFAIVNFAPKDPVYMYGVIVGKATLPIGKGEPITTANTIHETEKVIPKTEPYYWEQPNVDRWKNRTFMGYKRGDGKVGTANYWLVAPLVFCENRNIKVIRESLLNKLGYPDLKSHALDIDPLIRAYRRGVNSSDFKNIDLARMNFSKRERLFTNIDGIKFLNHNLGCGGTRSDAQALCDLVAGYIANPNVAGATILSLGCQNAEQNMLEKAIEKRDPQKLKQVFILEQQQSISEMELIQSAIKLTFTGLIEANKTARTPAPLNRLIVGLECGGSDGFSGISANPALGYASDVINALGGATILAEFPELNGIEQEIIHRCKSDRLAGRFYHLMEDYARKAEALGSGFDANPSPGNIKDGLITDAIKSAGAAKKGGNAPISDVLDYTDPVEHQGLNLLCTPGGDIESTTALAGSGANMIVFTTGLGTPTGNIISPVIKVSSNTALFQRMGDIIDMDAGTIISGEDSVESVGEKILEFMIEVASGNIQTKAQLLGQEDFIPWKRDISL
ncbi:MAG: altronate dehydratase family protein [Cytophagales bacterium]|nr:altronate dehydratase family protein [Cytophagales bacterium]